MVAVVFISEMSLLMESTAIKHKNKILTYTLYPTRDYIEIQKQMLK